MSQLRESLNPTGFEERNVGENNNNSGSVDIVVDPPSSDEADGGQLAENDSDPPIENENPEGNDVGARGQNSSLTLDERKKELENARKKSHHVHHRKRRKSIHNDGLYIPPYKKSRFRHLPSVLPSKFLLGGNIRDPLNLASLSDAKISAELNKVTPQSSPLPVKGEVPVFIPKNPHDPLGLTTRTPENPEDIVAGIRKNSCSRKHRHRKRPGRKRTDSECSIGTECSEANAIPEAVTKKEEIANEPSHKCKAKDIVPDQVSFYKKKEEIKVPEKAKGSTKEIAAITKKEEKQTSSSSNANNKVKEETSLPAATIIAPTAEPSSSSSQAKSQTPIANDQHNPQATPQEEEYEYQDYVQDEEPRPNYYNYYRRSSEYNPMGSTYSPSPFAFDSTEYFLEPPSYESPFNQYTPTHFLQPFSPPPLPEIPPFQRRMQIFTARPQHLSLQRAVFHRPANKKRPKHKGDPIVSPVVPQPGGSRRRGNHFNNKKPGDKANTSTDSTTSAGDSTDGKKYREKDIVFQFGNYNQYYGYRTADQGDPRLWALNKEYFESKEVLDIGCNSGHVTLSIARDFEPRRIHGIDIDFSLVTAARKNIKNFMIRDPDNKSVIFPKSLPMIYGAMQPPPAPGDKTTTVFPFNVSFAHENYVLSSDSQLDSVKPQYNVIMCLSVTKWIHLNFGDDGLKRFFKRTFLHLLDDGILILEPQPWSSYTKKKKLTEKIHKMYQSITFFPDQFEEFLLNDVGFSSSESLGTPVHSSKGFQRPLIMFKKVLALKQP